MPFIPEHPGIPEMQRELAALAGRTARTAPHPIIEPDTLMAIKVNMRTNVPNVKMLETTY